MCTCGAHVQVTDKLMRPMSEDVKVFEIIFSRLLLCKAVKDALSVRRYHRLQTVFLTGQFSYARPVVWQERCGILSGSLSLHLLHISVAPFGKGVLFSKKIGRHCRSVKGSAALRLHPGPMFDVPAGCWLKIFLDKAGSWHFFAYCAVVFPGFTSCPASDNCLAKKTVVVIRPVRFGGGNCWSKLFWRRRKLTTGGNRPAVSQN